MNPGKYIVTAIYEGYDVGNNVVVKSVLLTDDLSMKFKDGSKFNATVLDGQGKPLANQTVIFNINGVFYNKTTADDGVASLNIRLEIKLQSVRKNILLTLFFFLLTYSNNLIIPKPIEFFSPIPTS